MIHDHMIELPFSLSKFTMYSKRIPRTSMNVLFAILGPRHPSGPAGCVCEAPSAAANTVEISIAAPGEDERRS